LDGDIVAQKGDVVWTRHMGVWCVVYGFGLVTSDGSRENVERLENVEGMSEIARGARRDSRGKGV
jgi:hypothetical protein